jgi:hypothetical protein
MKPRWLVKATACRHGGVAIQIVDGVWVANKPAIPNCDRSGDASRPLIEAELVRLGQPLCQHCFWVSSPQRSQIEAEVSEAFYEQLPPRPATRRLTVVK